MEEVTSNSYIIFKGTRVNAVYMQQVIAEYKGNPLIEALPPILSKEEIITKLSKVPDYSQEERKLDPQYRYHCIQKLFNYFEPLQKHIDIEQRFSRVIRQGYISRNPIGPEYAAKLQNSYKMIKSGSYEFTEKSLCRTTASGFTVIGISGIGKTTTFERILSLYPQIIRHSEYKGICINLYQITWLKLDCPFDGSLKGLCINFFQAIDELLGTDYLRKYGSGRNSVDTMIPRMAHIASLHCIGVLIIDEIQHLNLSKSGGSDRMLNFFVTLVNTIGIPVILIGTTKALPILQGDFRQARRGSGQGDLVWDRMKKDAYWKLLIQGMWPLQWTKKENQLTEDIIDTIYDESQGIIDIAVKLYAMAQIRAIASGKEEINPPLIKQVAKDSLKLVRPMIDALKSGSVEEISKYGDITPIDFESFCYESIANSSVSVIRQDSNQKEIIMEYAVLKLVELGIKVKTAKTSVEKVLEESGSLDKLFIIKEAMKLAFQKEENNSKESKKASLKQKNDPEDLRNIVDEGKKKSKSAYEALKEAGYIKDPVKELLEKDDDNAQIFSCSIS